MRNLHKKISVVVAVLLLLSGSFSQGSVVHAARSRYDIGEPIPVSKLSWDERYYSNSYLLRGSEKFNYRIFSMDGRLAPQFAEKFFRSGMSFISFLYEEGINKGVHYFWIGGICYKIIFKENIKPSKPWEWWVNFPGM